MPTEQRSPAPVNVQHDAPPNTQRHLWWQGQKEERVQARNRTGLQSPQCGAVYRRLVLFTSLLTAAEKLYLLALSTRWGRRLVNCFPSRKKQCFALPNHPTLQRLGQLLQSCEVKGFLRCWSVTVVAEDEWICVVGYQFCLPAGVVGPEAWAGPLDWSKLEYGA